MYLYGVWLILGYIYKLLWNYYVGGSLVLVIIVLLLM